MSSQLSPLLLLLLLLLAPPGHHGCQEPELDRELVLAKVRVLFLDALGSPAVPREGGDPGIRRLPRRHAMGRRVSEPEEEDVSQAILFPATGKMGLEEVQVGTWRNGAIQVRIAWAREPGRAEFEFQAG